MTNVLLEELCNYLLLKQVDVGCLGFSGWAFRIFLVFRFFVVDFFGKKVKFLLSFVEAFHQTRRA